MSYRRGASTYTPEYAFEYQLLTAYREERRRLGLDREGPQWAENSVQLMSQENDKQIENLAHTVGLMKSVCSPQTTSDLQSMHSLHRVIGKGDPLLVDIVCRRRKATHLFKESGMETGQGLLQSNISKITKLTEDGSYKHMCLLILFTIFVFFLLWWMIR